MDADDRGDPDRFKKLLDALTQHPGWTAVCSQVRIFGTVSEAQGRLGNLHSMFAIAVNFQIACYYSALFSCNLSVETLV